MKKRLIQACIINISFFLQATLCAAALQDGDTAREKAARHTMDQAYFKLWDHANQLDPESEKEFLSLRIQILISKNATPTAKERYEDLCNQITQNTIMDTLKQLKSLTDKDQVFCKGVGKYIQWPQISTDPRTNLTLSAYWTSRKDLACLLTAKRDYMTLELNDPWISEQDALKLFNSQAKNDSSPLALAKFVIGQDTIVGIAIDSPLDYKRRQFIDLIPYIHKNFIMATIVHDPPHKEVEGAGLEIAMFRKKPELVRRHLLERLVTNESRATLSLYPYFVIQGTIFDYYPAHIDYFVTKQLAGDAKIISVSAAMKNYLEWPKEIQTVYEAFEKDPNTIAQLNAIKEEANRWFEGKAMKSNKALADELETKYHERCYDLIQGTYLTYE